MQPSVDQESRVFRLTLEDLQDDALRRKAPLERSDVDALYLKRGITPEQAIAIEKALTSSGIEILDGELDASSDTPDVETPGISNSALDHLMRQSRKRPLLTHQDEIRLGRTIQRALSIDPNASDDISKRVLEAAEKARAELITCNVRLVAKVAWDRRFRGRLDPDDLVQIGLIGLMRAAEKYDPAWETRFSTYAMWWIRQAMGRGIDDQGTTIRVPVHMRQAIAHYRRTLRQLQGAGVTPQITLIAEKLGWTEEYTAKIATFSEQRTVSLETPIPGSDDLKLKDLLIDKNQVPEQSVFDRDIGAKVRELIDEIDDDRLEDILCRRFGIYGNPQTLEEIGQDYGVTRERIRQLEAKALKILKRRKLTRHLARMLFPGRNR